jgi:hypothetical protein
MYQRKDYPGPIDGNWPMGELSANCAWLENISLANYKENILGSSSV